MEVVPSSRVTLPRRQIEVPISQVNEMSMSRQHVRHGVANLRRSHLLRLTVKFPIVAQFFREEIIIGIQELDVLSF